MDLAGLLGCDSLKQRRPVFAPVAIGEPATLVVLPSTAVIQWPRSLRRR
jgi:hypothetical protein